jgi:hypothetical protein
MWNPACFSLPFIMLNPSTADAEVDDPTIRRCMGFARREGYGGIIVVNLFGLRSPTPKRLKEDRDVIGPENEKHLDEVAMACVETGVPMVCAWGAHGGFRAGFLVDRLRVLGVQLLCLGTTNDGSPRHPLYVKRDAPLVPLPHAMHLHEQALPC